MAYCITNLSLNLLVRAFLNWLTFGQVTGKMVDCVIRSIRLTNLSSKIQNSSDKIKQLVSYGQKLLLIVVMLIGRLM